MADLYRKASLERISSPEQLDKALKITSPLSWLALLAVTAMLVVLVIWSIVGRLSQTVSVSGMIVSPTSTNSIFSDESGVVTAVLKAQGDEVHLGDDVMTIQTARNETYTVKSDQVGTISEVLCTVGMNVNQNNEVLRISPKVTGKQAVVCYVPVSEAKKIARDMKTYVYLASADSQTYGHMEARVINIDAKASSAASVNNIVGSDNNLAQSFLQNGAVTAVTLELWPDEKTQNGYYWSSEKGGSVDVSNGSLCSAKIITDEIAPISKLFAKIEEIWGD